MTTSAPSLATVFSPRPAPRARTIAIAVALLALGLAACTSTPIQPGDGVTVSPLTVAEAALAEPMPEVTVLWGGTVVGVSNLEVESVIEVLAYPLDRIQRPMVTVPSQGRFVIVQDGFVEPLDVAPGRQLTVLGALSGSIDGSVGDAELDFPRVLADELHLWRPGGSAEPPRFTFGLGIGVDL